MSSKHLSVAEIAEIREIFQRFDHNNNGAIEPVEFRALLEALGGSTSPEAIEEALTAFDKNADGVVEFGEFLAWFREQN